MPQYIRNNLSDDEQNKLVAELDKLADEMTRLRALYKPTSTKGKKTSSLKEKIRKGQFDNKYRIRKILNDSLPLSNELRKEQFVDKRRMRQVKKAEEAEKLQRKRSAFRKMYKATMRSLAKKNSWGKNDLKEELKAWDEKYAKDEDLDSEYGYLYKKRALTTDNVLGKINAEYTPLIPGDDNVEDYGLFS